VDETTQEWVEEVLDEALIPNFTITRRKYDWEVTLGNFSLSERSLKTITQYKPFRELVIRDGKLTLYFDF